MAVKGAVVSVGTTPTLLAQAPAEETQGGEQLTVYVKIGGTTVDLGGPTVASGSGYQPTTNSVVGPLSLGNGEALYGVAASGTVNVQVLSNYN